MITVDKIENTLDEIGIIDDIVWTIIQFMDYSVMDDMKHNIEPKNCENELLAYLIPELQDKIYVSTVRVDGELRLILEYPDHNPLISHHPDDIISQVNKLVNESIKSQRIGFKEVVWRQFVGGGGTDFKKILFSPTLKEFKHLIDERYRFNTRNNLDTVRWGRLNCNINIYTNESIMIIDVH